MTISKTSKIEENTSIYIVNGNWFAYVVRDCVTDDLILFIPMPSKRSRIKTFDQSSTYEEVFPDNNIRISNTEQKMFSNLPFEVGVYAADEESIYEIVGSSNSKSLVTTSSIELGKIKVRVKDLATDEISVKSVSELCIHGFNDEFNDNLIKLTKSSNPAVKAYLKAAYLYSKDFKDMINHAEGMLALDDDSNFLALLKDICGGCSSNRLNTRGEYFVNGDDIQFYTSIEDDKVVTCKVKHNVDERKMILLNRDERTVQEYRKLIKPILDKYKTSLAEAIQILHEPNGTIRTRYSYPYREPDSVELEKCEIFKK